MVSSGDSACLSHKVYLRAMTQTRYDFFTLCLYHSTHARGRTETGVAGQGASEHGPAQQRTASLTSRSADQKPETRGRPRARQRTESARYQCYSSPPPPGRSALCGLSGRAAVGFGLASEENVVGGLVKAGLAASALSQPAHALESGHARHVRCRSQLR